MSENPIAKYVNPCPNCGSTELACGDCRDSREWWEAIPNCTECAELRERVAAAEAEAARLQSALRLYGTHKPSCATREPGAQFGPEFPCNCGLVAALSPTAAQPPTPVVAGTAGGEGKENTDAT